MQEIYNSVIILYISVIINLREKGSVYGLSKTDGDFCQLF